MININIGKFIDKIKGRNKWDYYYTLLNSNYNSSQIIQVRLKKLLIHARKTVPFYQKILDGSISEEKVFDKLKELPIVGKNELNSKKEVFISAEKQKGIYENSTGGSTGVPLKVLQDQKYSDWAGATKLLFYTWAGWKPRDRILKIWKSPKDVFKQGKII